MDVPIPCICPRKGDASRHPDGDTVMLRETLGFRAVTTLRWVVRYLKETDPDISTPAVLAALTEEYAIAGVESWTVVDAKGQPIEASPAAVREFLLPHIDAATIVADAADMLYLVVMLPLLSPASTSSPDTPIAESTSPKNGSPQKPPKPSKQSSISTIPTAGTEVTSSSLDGDSSSLPNSVSAA
jgi:hypothetical protein